MANPYAMPDNISMILKYWLRRAPLRVSLVAAVSCLAALSASAQQQTSRESWKQTTDISFNLYGNLAPTATGPVLTNSAGTAVPNAPPLTQTVDPFVGFRFGVRHIFSPIFGLEANFAYNRANQNFRGSGIQNGVVYSHAKPITFDYVATLPHELFGVRPFVVAGGGAISYNISSTSNLPARPEWIPVFEYAIGADYHPVRFPNFMSLRFQYRALVGHAPDYLLPYLATNNLINSSEPQGGVVFHF